MNPPQFAHSISEWRPPSPSSTPQSAKFNNYQFVSPTNSEPSPGFGNVWQTPQTYAYSSGFTTPQLAVPNQEGLSASSLKRPRPISYQNIDANGQLHGYIPLSETHVQPQSAQTSFSHSFIEQFHGTHIDEAQGNSAIPAPTQVHTPPPTRKMPAKKKASASLVIPVETPPTILSRRMSDHDAWLRQFGQNPTFEASPFNITPLQITPPEPMSFPSGPLTAPVYPHSQLFWDPNTQPDVAHVNLPAQTDGHFIGNAQYVPAGYVYQQAGLSPATAVPAPQFCLPALPGQVPSRPQSARPADAAQAMAPPPLPSHIRKPSTLDPSMLVSAVYTNQDGLVQSNPGMSIGSLEGRQPYQYQFESLQREKEVEARKIRRQTTVDSAIIGSAGVDLRRTLTETRAKKALSVPQAAVTPTKESNVGFAPITEHVIRTGSPMKKSRSSLFQTAVSPLKNITPKSVVLTIDEKGHATTQVTAVDEQKLPSRRSSASLHASSASSESESDDEGVVLPPPSGSRRGSAAMSIKRPTARPSPPSDEAQNALRQIVKAKRQTGSVGSMSRGTNTPVPMMPPQMIAPAPMQYPARTDSVNWNISPTTVTDPELQTPIFNQDAQFVGGTRCICNNSIGDEGQLMIKCESCLKWQHMDCLGLQRDRLPSHFFCIYCTAMTMQGYDQKQQQMDYTVQPQMGYYNAPFYAQDYV